MGGPRPRCLQVFMQETLGLFLHSILKAGPRLDKANTFSGAHKTEGKPASCSGIDHGQTFASASSAPNCRNLRADRTIDARPEFLRGSRVTCSRTPPHSEHPQSKTQTLPGGGFFIS